MLPRSRLGRNNALMSRVRRYASMATLFRYSDAAAASRPGAPPGGLQSGDSPTPSSPTVVATLLPVNTSLPVGQVLPTAAGTPLQAVPQPGAGAGAVQRALQHVARIPVTSPPLTTAPAETSPPPREPQPAVAEAPQPEPVADDLSAEDSEWRRLQRAWRGYRAKLARERQEAEASGQLQREAEEKERQAELERQQAEEQARRQELARTGRLPRAQVVYLSPEERERTPSPRPALRPEVGAEETAPASTQREMIPEALEGEAEAAPVPAEPEGTGPPAKAEALPTQEVAPALEDTAIAEAGAVPEPAAEAPAPKPPSPKAVPTLPRARDARPIQRKPEAARPEEPRPAAPELPSAKKPVPSAVQRQVEPEAPGPTGTLPRHTEEASPQEAAPEAEAAELPVESVTEGGELSKPVLAETQPLAEPEPDEELAPPTFEAQAPEERPEPAAPSRRAAESVPPAGQPPATPTIQAVPEEGRTGPIPTPSRPAEPPDEQPGLGRRMLDAMRSFIGREPEPAEPSVKEELVGEPAPPTQPAVQRQVIEGPPERAPIEERPPIEGAAEGPPGIETIPDRMAPEAEPRLVRTEPSPAAPSVQAAPEAPAKPAAREAETPLARPAADHGAPSEQEPPGSLALSTEEVSDGVRAGPEPDRPAPLVKEARESAPEPTAPSTVPEVEARPGRPAPSVQAAEESPPSPVAPEAEARRDVPEPSRPAPAVQEEPLEHPALPVEPEAEGVRAQPEPGRPTPTVQATLERPQIPTTPEPPVVRATVARPQEPPAEPAPAVEEPALAPEAQFGTQLEAEPEVPVELPRAGPAPGTPTPTVSRQVERPVDEAPIGEPQPPVVQRKVEEAEIETQIVPRPEAPAEVPDVAPVVALDSDEGDRPTGEETLVERAPVSPATEPKPTVSRKAEPEILPPPEPVGEPDTTMIQPVPLEEAWPVRRIKQPEPPRHLPPRPIAKKPAAPKQAVQRKPAGDDEVSASLHTTLGTVSPGRETDSAIELVTPRRPRPVPEPPPERLPSDAQRQPPDEIRPAAEAPAETVAQKEAAAAAPEATRMVDTDVGPLPADFWELLGEKPPAPEEAKAPPVPTEGKPAETAVQRAIEAVERPARAAERPRGRELPPPAPVMQQVVLPQVQRMDREPAERAAAEETAGEAEEEEGEGQPLDIEQLAWQIYPIIKRYLAVERERRSIRF